MKTNRIPLYKWTNPRGVDMIDVPWPKVHGAAGNDSISWLLKQPQEHCQLVVDKFNEQLTLVAEFYNEGTLINYHLHWAK